MNDKLSELAERAGFMDSWFSESGDDCEQELRKFAELIVKECANVAADHDALDIYEEIREHFEVEE